MSQEQVSTEELNGRFAALQAQRDEANNRIVMLHGMVAKLEASVKALKDKYEPSSPPSDSPPAA